MANIMSLKPLKNNVKRNGFDLSFKQNFTAKAGELLPVGVWEVYPGDTFKIDLSSFTRTLPINTAAFARMREYYDFYFVPYEQLWRFSNTVLTQMYDNPYHAVYLNEQDTTLGQQMPFFSTAQVANYIYTLKTWTPAPTGKDVRTNYFGFDRATATCKLMEYLGYGNYYKYLETYYTNAPRGKNLDINCLSLLAYQKIYNDHFRNSQWERPNPAAFNCDYIVSSPFDNSQIPIPTNQHVTDFQKFIDSYNMFDLRYCNWQQDMFHGVLPSAQYGSPSMVPISSGSQIDSSAVLRVGVFSSDSTSTNEFNLYAKPTPSSSSLASYNPYIDRNTQQLRDLIINDVKLRLKSSSDIGSLSILLLRQYEALQKWKEISQSGDKDFRTQVSKHWNVGMSDAYSELSTYLGGIASNIDINEVQNTNLADNNAAYIAGKGIGSGRKQINFTSNGQYGVLMCIYHTLPVLDYTTDYVLPQHTKVNSTDFAIPEFDSIGMQPVSTFNLCNGLVSEMSPNPPTQLGYAPRYFDLKTSFDRSIGAFKHINSMSNYVINYGNDAFINQINSAPQPELSNNEINAANYTTFKVDPHSVDPLFTQDADDNLDTDPFLCSAFFDVKAVRNLDTNGLPY